jgi:hypothetical protein
VGGDRGCSSSLAGSSFSPRPHSHRASPGPAPPLDAGPHQVCRRSSFSPRHRSSSSPPPVPIKLTTVQLLPSPPVQLLTSLLVKLLPVAASGILAVTVDLVPPPVLSSPTRHRDDARCGCGRGERIRQDPHSPPPSWLMRARAMRRVLEMVLPIRQLKTSCA